MRAMMLQLLRIPLARDTDHKSEVSISAGLNSGDGILDDNRPFGSDPEQLCRHQERIRGGFPGKTLRMDHVAIDLHLEEVIQLGGLQHGRAVLTRGDDGDFEPVAAELMDELHASVVGLHAHVRDDNVDQVVLAVPEPAYCFDLCQDLQDCPRGVGYRARRESRERRRNEASHPRRAGSPWRDRRGEMLRLCASHASEDTRRTSVSNTSRGGWRCPLSHRRDQKGRHRTGRG